VDPANKTIEIYTPASGGDVPILYLSESGTVQSIHQKNIQFELKDIF
jgi:hypothetical protein